MTIFPTKNYLPNLSHLSPDRLLVRFHDSLTGDRGRQYQDRALMTNLARLVDRAIALYISGSSYIDEWLAAQPSTNVTGFFRAVSTFEQCVTCTHRASLHAGELAKRGIIDPSLLKIDPRIKEIRDAMEHFDDRILGRRQPPVQFGDPTFLAPADNGLVLGKHVLPYSGLADTLTSLHDAVGKPIG